MFLYKIITFLFALHNSEHPVLTCSSVKGLNLETFLRLPIVYNRLIYRGEREAG